MARAALRLLRLPLDDYLAALAPFAAGIRLPRAVLAVAAAALSWWLYVPVHELLHALGCLAGGGTVTRLEIDPVYGAAYLQRVFPFVAVGSAYAGQLTGFDTGGRDLTYLLTDALPFALTVLIGVPLLRAAARRPPGAGQALLLGASLPIAFAPFISLPGDYYEMGSILVTRLVAIVSPGFDVARWRSDDVLKLAGELRAAGGTPGDALGVAAGFTLGGVLAFATYACGAAVSNLAAGRARAAGEAG